jgi:hypothetical protein
MVILLVDDDDADAASFERSLQQVAPTATCFRVKTPAEAHWYLLGLGRYEDRDRYPLPRMVVVYLEMRGGNGTDFLDWLGTQAELEGIRACLFTRTRLDPLEEERLTRASGCVFTKPESEQEWEAILKRVISTELAEHALPG